jgi:hypothetical protein
VPSLRPLTAAETEALVGGELLAARAAVSFDSGFLVVLPPQIFRPAWAHSPAPGQLRRGLQLRNVIPTFAAALGPSAPHDRRHHHRRRRRKHRRPEQSKQPIERRTTVSGGGLGASYTASSSSSLRSSAGNIFTTEGLVPMILKRAEHVMFVKLIMPLPQSSIDPRSAFTTGALANVATAGPRALTELQVFALVR